MDERGWRGGHAVAPKRDCSDVRVKVMHKARAFLTAESDRIFLLFIYSNRGIFPSIPLLLESITLRIDSTSKASAQLVSIYSIDKPIRLGFWAVVL